MRMVGSGIFSPSWSSNYSNSHSIVSRPYTSSLKTLRAIPGILQRHRSLTPAPHSLNHRSYRELSSANDRNVRTPNIASHPTSNISSSATHSWSKNAWANGRSRLQDPGVAVPQRSRPAGNASRTEQALDVNAAERTVDFSSFGGFTVAVGVIRL